MDIQLPASNEQMQQSIKAMDLEDPQTNAHGIVWSIMGSRRFRSKALHHHFQLRSLPHLCSCGVRSVASAGCYTISVVNAPIESRCIPSGSGETLSPRELFVVG